MCISGANTERKNIGGKKSVQIFIVAKKFVIQR